MSTNPDGSRSFDVLPPGPLHKRRKYAIARFQQGAPDFKSGDWQAVLERPEGRRKESAKVPPSMVLSCHGDADTATADESAAAAVLEQLRGVPEGSALSSYFVLMKQGNDFTALPVEQIYGFKPVVLHAKKLTLEEAEEAMRNPQASAAAAAGAAAASAARGGPAARGAAARGGAAAPAASPLDRFAPKSVRAAVKEAADDAKRDEAFKAVFQPSAAQIAAMADELDRPKVVGAEDEDYDDYDLFGTDDEGGGGGKKGGRGKGGGKGGGGGGGGGKRGGGGDGDEGGPALAEDEVPEDIYHGEVDELRPQAPDENAQWEFEVQPDDDDQDQGASDDDLADDPFTRKELGLKAGLGDDGSEEEPERSEDEEEAADEDDATRAAKERERRFQELKERSERAAERIAAGEEVEEEEDEEYYANEGEGEGEEEEDLGGGDIDFDTLDALERKRSQQIAPPGARQRSPAPAALRAGGTASPSGGQQQQQAAGQRAQQPRRTPPPGAGQQQQRRTPPPAAAPGGAPKRRADTSPPPAAPAAAEAKRPRLSPAPAAAAAAAAAPPPAAAAANTGAPSDAEIVAALSNGPLTVQQLVAIFKGRLADAASKQDFKVAMMRVGEMVPAPAGQKGSMVRLKQR